MHQSLRTSACLCTGVRDRLKYHSTLGLDTGLPRQARGPTKGSDRRTPALGRVGVPDRSRAQAEATTAPSSHSPTRSRATPSGPCAPRRPSTCARPSRPRPEHFRTTPLLQKGPPRTPLPWRRQRISGPTETCLWDASGTARLGEWAVGFRITPWRRPVQADEDA